MIGAIGLASGLTGNHARCAAQLHFKVAVNLAMIRLHNNVRFEIAWKSHVDVAVEQTPESVVIQANRPAPTNDPPQ